MYELLRLKPLNAQVFTVNISLLFKVKLKMEILTRYVLALMGAFGVMNMYFCR